MKENKNNILKGKTTLLMLRCGPLQNRSIQFSTVMFGEIALRLNDLCNFDCKRQGVYSESEEN